MVHSRERILQRVRAALHDVPPATDDRREPRYRRKDDLPRAEIVALFACRVAEYRAIIAPVSRLDLSGAILAACMRRAAQHMVVPLDIPDDWLPRGEIEFMPDHALSPQELDRSDGVLTGCALGIAETGTIVLDGGLHQGRRAISLVPDYHLCVVFEEQIVGLVPEAIERLHGAVQEGRPITYISGPSATSDIELNRVEGVHGPRTLEVLLVSSDAQ